MSVINGATLMMAIQAVDAQIVSLSRTLAQPIAETNRQKLESLLQDYRYAAVNLRDAYLEAQSTFSNLPPYEALVHQG